MTQTNILTGFKSRLTKQARCIGRPQSKMVYADVHDKVSAGGRGHRDPYYGLTEGLMGSFRNQFLTQGTHLGMCLHAKQTPTSIKLAGRANLPCHHPLVLHPGGVGGLWSWGRLLNLDLSEPC